MLKKKRLKKKKFNLNYKKNSILKTSNKIFQLAQKKNELKYFNDN